MYIKNWESSHKIPQGVLRNSWLVNVDSMIIQILEGTGGGESLNLSENKKLWTLENENS